MDRRRQPAMGAGGGAAHPWPDASEDEAYDWSEPTVLTRGWALARLVGLVLLCGLGAGAVIGITLWLTLVAIDSSL